MDRHFKPRSHSLPRPDRVRITSKNGTRKADAVKREEDTMKT